MDLDETELSGAKVYAYAANPETDDLSNEIHIWAHGVNVTIRIRDAHHGTGLAPHPAVRVNVGHQSQTPLAVSVDDEEVYTSTVGVPVD